MTGDPLLSPAGRPAPHRRWSVPVPHEHGAWMMLYAPLLTGLAAFAVPAATAAALVVLVTAAFFAQNAAGLLLRRRAAPGTGAWLALFAALTLVSGAWLVIGLGHHVLVPLGLPGLALFAWQARHRRVTHRQVDRSLGNELATVAVLSLGAAAAGVVGPSPSRWALAGAWALFTAYFSGSVFYVKMRVEAARQRAAPTAAWRWRTGRLCGLHHLTAAAVTAVLAGAAAGPRAGVLTGLAWAPSVVRALVAWARLTVEGVPLRRIGVMELGWAAWFSTGVGLALSGP